MQLWTEYEGHTIDGAFSLEKLLLSEGRSAFFSTSNGSGVPTLIRLIASHFDEEEILARWRGVGALGHANILKIERYGQIVLDDTTMVYAIFEPVDASLADVIVGQRLTLPDAKQLALSLASALNVLHKNGFVHEHVEPAKIFAVGEVVKLRGDCIRETPEGELGREARKKDAHDLAVVILVALTQTETLEKAANFRPLPFPFDEIVRNGLNNTWELDQIVAALDTVKPVVPALRTSVSDEKPREVAGATIEPDRGQDIQESIGPKGKFVPPGQRRPIDTHDLSGGNPLFGKWAILTGLMIVIAFWIIWHVLHLRPEAKSATPEIPAASSTVAASGSEKQGAIQTGAGPNSAANRSTASHSGQVASPLPPRQNGASTGRGQWRVVAFTYNHTDQARKKVETITQQHANLRPEVFTPTGHAPYLVTVGGAMSRDQAFAFAQQVRKLGLPRDTYAQNYNSKRP